MTLTVTRADILSWDPCANYPERIPEILPGRAARRWSVLDLIAAGHKAKVPAADILWAIMRPELIEENDLHELACRFASRALRQERKAEWQLDCLKRFLRSRP